MLTDLHIKNFAIIDNLQLSFGPGLNILTGETGAGKSIIIGAIELILGGRASGQLIRTGEEEAVVEAIFDLSGDGPAVAWLAESGIDVAGELLVKRVISRSGKNRVYVNGGLSTMALLGEIARQLVNIYGQHESQTLLRPENHLLLLDGYAGLLPLRVECAAIFAEYGRVREEMHSLEESEREANRRMDLLAFQSREIGAVELNVDEEEELPRERQLLLHAEKLYQNSSLAYEMLYDGEPTVLGLLTEVKTKLSDISAIDTALAPVLDSINNACIQLEDAGLSLRDYAARVEADPERLRQLDDRLELLQRLKKKYAPTVKEIIAFKEQVDRELEQLANRDQTREELAERMSVLENRLLETARTLSAQRRAAAVRIKRAMEKELHELAMKNAVLEVSFEDLAEPKTFGLERAEFVFSPNPGETPKSLTRIASGGELSRLMLAIKQIHPESDVPTLIFDEVDSGIGGVTSVLVGKKLKKVSRCQQVLCITHLPQVAAFADQHFQVEKHVEAGRTSTRVNALAGDERIRELARMLGGMKISEKSLAHAREMLEEAIQREEN